MESASSLFYRCFSLRSPSAQTSNSRVGYPSERRARVTPATQTQQGRRGGKGGRTERREGEKRLLVIGAKSSFVLVFEGQTSEKKNRKVSHKPNTAVIEYKGSF